MGSHSSTVLYNTVIRWRKVKRCSNISDFHPRQLSREVEYLPYLDGNTVSVVAIKQTNKPWDLLHSRKKGLSCGLWTVSLLCTSWEKEAKTTYPIQQHPFLSPLSLRRMCCVLFGLFDLGEAARPRGRRGRRLVNFKQCPSFLANNCTNIYVAHENIWFIKESDWLYMFYVNARL